MYTDPLFILGVFLFMLFLAGFWMMYLIKLALNDEEIQEKQRQIRRKHEEELRELEDRARKQRKSAQEEEAAIDRVIQKESSAEGEAKTGAKG